jgi:hypothetical protein
MNRNEIVLLRHEMLCVSIWGLCIHDLSVYSVVAVGVRQVVKRRYIIKQLLKADYASLPKLQLNEDM